MAQFKVGDVVKLKSGGPRMTVREIPQDGDPICEWFVKTKLERGVFKEATLELAGRPRLAASF